MTPENDKRVILTYDPESLDAAFVGSHTVETTDGENDRPVRMPTPREAYLLLQLQPEREFLRAGAGGCGSFHVVARQG